MNENRGWRRLLRVDAMLLAVAVLAGVAGAVLSGRFLGARAAATEASLRNRYEPKAVVVAAADLSQGESLDATRLAVRKMPREFLPADAVPAERAAELIGTRTAIQIRRGTPVVPAALRRNDRPASLSAVLDGERRALTIAVDEVNSQAGNLVPGDWVDLYYSRSNGGEAMLAPLLQRVEVLAAGTALRADAEHAEVAADRGFSTITLGLSATDASRVILAQQSGSVSVVLRSAADFSEMSADARSSQDLLNRARRRSSPEARIELLTGGNGGMTPDRSWLPVGQGRPASGDAS